MPEAMSVKQIEFLRGSDQRVNILEGAIRSGKTIVALLRWLMYIPVSPQDGELVMVGRTRDSVWRNMIGPLQSYELFGVLSHQVVGNYGAPTVKILGRTVHVLGASDAKAEKVIRGLTVAGVMVDEVTTIPEEFFTQLLGRLSKTDAKMFGTTNPDSPAHYLKQKYLDRINAGAKPLTNWSRWSFTIDDNPSLDPDYVASIKSEFTGLWYRRFILGEWVAAEGAIYSMWDPDRHVVPHDSLPPMQRLLGVGIDFGTSNASAALILGLGEDGNLYFVDEWRHDPKQTHIQLSASQTATQIREWLDLNRLPNSTTQRPEWIFYDPAAASLGVEFQQMKVSNLAKADNTVLYGIQTMASLLTEGKLFISDRCKGLIGEIPGYSWDTAATEKGEDKPLKIADHSCDAARYVLVTSETNWRNRVDTARKLQAA